MLTVEDFKRFSFLISNYGYSTRTVPSIFNMISKASNDFEKLTIIELVNEVYDDFYI